MGLKKISSILMLGLMLQYSFGLQIVYSWNGFAIKQLMKAAISNGTFQHNQIVTFTVPLQQFITSPGSYFQEDEIELAGKMYDVVSARQHGNCITIQAICDNDETGLINNYQEVMGSTKQSLPGTHLAGLKSFFSSFVISACPLIVHQTIQNEKGRLLYETKTFPVTLYSKVLKPPPRFV